MTMRHMSDKEVGDLVVAAWFLILFLGVGFLFWWPLILISWHYWVG
jgi:hypothetical protein